ncbi:MAG: hypothetical protein SGJ11_02390 [Phycisphaerae bacterium]|nr:hypothetical protein [Phycisphaerae bacterium]
MKAFLAACGAFTLVPLASANDINQRESEAMQINKDWIDKNMQGWPEETKEAAAVTIAAHGPPEAVGTGLIVWGKCGAWKRILLHRHDVPHEFAMPRKYVRLRFVDKTVPADTFDQLANCDTR